MFKISSEESYYQYLKLNHFFILKIEQSQNILLIDNKVIDRMYEKYLTKWSLSLEDCLNCNTYLIQGRNMERFWMGWRRKFTFHCNPLCHMNFLDFMHALVSWRKPHTDLPIISYVATICQAGYWSKWVTHQGNHSRVKWPVNAT